MIARFRGWRRLERTQRRRVLAAAALQLVCTAALRVVPFRRLARIGRCKIDATVTPDLVALNSWLCAIEAAGRHLGPASTCLARALVARWIASRSGVDLQIAIGVARGGGESLDAHAWITGPHALHLGASSASRYVPLVTSDNLSTT